MEERRNRIIELLKKEQRVSVKKLSEKFFVSEMTIRRDLKELEKSGYLKRYNGGAIVVEGEKIPIKERKLLYSADKLNLAKKIKPLLSDSMTVFIDSSSTCMYIIPLLSEYKNIIVVTNSVQSLLLAARYHIKCIIAGGLYYEEDMCSIGGITEEFLSGINVDIAFIAPLGISNDGIISDSDENQTAVRRVIMKNSAKNVFLFSKEKQNKKYLYTLCHADEADEIIES